MLIQSVLPLTHSPLALTVFNASTAAMNDGPSNMSVVGWLQVGR